MDVEGGPGGRAETEVSALVAGSDVTAGCRDSLPLAIDFDLEPETIAVAACALESDGQPVVLVALTEKHYRTLAEHGHDNVGMTVVVEFCESCTAGRHRGSEAERWRSQRPWR